jgi:hypothetical protein
MVKGFVFTSTLFFFWATLLCGQSSVITMQPQNQTAAVGQTATFTISISDPTCSVMWQRNGSNVAGGADLVGYTTSPVTLADNGVKFGAVVYNCKTAANGHSGTATLTVTTGSTSGQSSVITKQPQNQTAVVGQTATFTVSISDPTCSVIWQRNGSNVAGGADLVGYTTSPVTLADNGAKFGAVVYNCKTAAGAHSGTATLAVSTTTTQMAPTIAMQPARAMVTAGNIATFSVVANGTAPLSYQWRKNGANIAGATAASYTTPPTTTSDNGATFVVVVSNSVGNVMSSPATLTVSPTSVAPAISGQPASQTVAAGQAASFSVVASGTAPLSYQWKKNGANITGATAAKYTTPADTSADNGSKFQALVSNSVGSTMSSAATLTVGGVVAPTITMQPANQTVTTGQTATFSVAATGSGPLSYQWQKNGGSIAGATAASYTTPSAAITDNGSTFVIVVSNSAGTATSNAATLTVTPDTIRPTVLITSPSSGTTVSGTMTVTASASDNVGVARVQLQVDGTNIGAADASAPYDFSLDTTTLSNGSHTVTAVAVDTSGNESASAPVAVTVSNGVSTGTPGPLAVCFSNPRYFCDPSGNVVFLSGHSAWANAQDLGNNPYPNTGQFDFAGYVNFIQAHGYTWVDFWDATMYSHDFCCTSYNPYVGSPWPWLRAGPGNGDDGLLKTDFTQFDVTYFSRIRSRVISLGQVGAYVSVMVWNDISELADATGNGDPFVATNNVNGISGGRAAAVSNKITSSGAIWTSVEQPYIHHLVDTLHDLPNVLWEVGVEPPVSNAAWVTAIMNEIRTYEQTTYGTHHPIGINYGQNVPDSNVYNTNADYVHPSTKVPPAATGQCPVLTGNGGAANTSSGRCKVVINDSDHSYYYTYMLSDGPTDQIAWAWENFTLGNGVAFMDPYTFPWSGRNPCTGTPSDGDSGLCATNGLDPQWNSIRQAIKDVVTYAKKIDLKDMTPEQQLFSSGYGLASTSAPVSYLMFSPSGSAAETITTVPGTYTVEVFDTLKHSVVSVVPNVSIGAKYSFSPPASDNYAVWIH